MIARPRQLEAARRRRLTTSSPHRHHVPSALQDVVLDAVATLYRISPAQLASTRRDAYLVDARRIVCQLLYERDCGTEAIVRVLGRDHSTVVHALHHLEHKLSAEDWTMLSDARYSVRARLAQNGGGS